MSWVMGFIALTWWIWAAILYGAAFLFVVRWAISYAKKNGKSARRWGWGAALVMYMIPFWDFIPTVVVHQFYCAKDSGFWAYKTLDQWKAENPGVMEGLTTQRIWQHDYANGGDVVHINQRFDLVYKKDRPISTVGRDERRFIDVKTGDLLGRFVDFSSRDVKWDGLKFWMNNQHCAGGRDNAINFGNFYIQFKGAEK